MKPSSLFRSKYTETCLNENKRLGLWPATTHEARIQATSPDSMLLA